MTRAENILFALYAFRVGILDRDQFLAICGSLRHGKDIDIGMSLAKRGVVDDQQMEALWSLVGAQVNVLGDAKSALDAIDAGPQVRLAVQLAVKMPKPPAAQPPKGFDPPTIRLDQPPEES